MRSIPLLFSIVLALLPAAIPAPPTIPHEKGSIVVSAAGNSQRWTASWTMEPAQVNGRRAVHFTEVGRGQYSGYSQPIAWTTDATWIADGSFRPLQFEKTITDMNGRRLATERKIFDPAKGTVQFERKREGAPPDIEQFAAPADSLVPEGIAGILQFLPFEQWEPTRMHLFSNEPKMYEVKLVMKGRERVQTSAGEYECYKIELVPELGALNLFRTFLPKAYFWFSVAPPHFWVKYEGPENGAGTPQIAMILKTYESQ